MATLTIRNLDEDLKTLLRVEAARRGHSMEEEARLILKRALTAAQPKRGLGTRIHQRFVELGGADLELPSRSEPPRAADLSE
jgi:plasmid stability protein